MNQLKNWIDWFEKNYDMLQEKYVDKFVAIYKNKVIASGNSYKKVYLKARQITKDEVYIDFVEGGYLSVY